MTPTAESEWRDRRVTDEQVDELFDRFLARRCADRLRELRSRVRLLDAGGSTTSDNGGEW